LVLDDAAAESIQKMVSLAKENMDQYLTITPEIAQTSVELMKFYVDTKKLMYGFPLITIPPAQEISIGPSVSQQNNMINQNIDQNNVYQTVQNNSNRSVVSHYSGFSSVASSHDPFYGNVIDATIKKILFYRKQEISSNRLAQILRVSNHLFINNLTNIFLLFLFHTTLASRS